MVTSRIGIQPRLGSKQSVTEKSTYLTLVMFWVMRPHSKMQRRQEMLANATIGEHCTTISNSQDYGKFDAQGVRTRVMFHTEDSLLMCVT